MNEAASEQQPKKGLSSSWIILIVLLIFALGLFFAIRYYFWPSPYKPTELSKKEEQRLEQKVQKVIPGFRFNSGKAQGSDSEVRKLEPEAYTEEGAERSLEFSEREINALLAKNTDFADKLAIDLADNLVSATLLVPMEEGFPFVGGKTVRINTGMGLEFKDGRLVAVLKGVSVMGVPLPNDWLGGLKNVDLVEQFDGQGGFWESFANGIEQLTVQNGRLAIELAE